MWAVFHDFFTTVKNTSPPLHLSRSRSHNFQKRITKPNFYLRLGIIVETAMTKREKEEEKKENAARSLSRWIGSPTVRPEWNRRWAISVLHGRMNETVSLFRSLRVAQVAPRWETRFLCHRCTPVSPPYRHSILIGPLSSSSSSFSSSSSRSLLSSNRRSFRLTFKFNQKNISNHEY